MCSILTEGDVAVDAGAYKGAYTYWMRGSVGERGAVLAFEPQPELAVYLRRGVSAFHWRNVTVVERALSAEAGERELRVPSHGPSPGASLTGASVPPNPRTYPVAVDTLDCAVARHLSGRRVRLLKCDVEGHELDVFLGASRTLREHRPLLLFECEARHRPNRSVAEVFDHLHAFDYHGWFFDRGQRVDVAEFDDARHQVEGARPYRNNFVFAPDGTV